MCGVSPDLCSHNYGLAIKPARVQSTWGGDSTCLGGVSER